MRTVDQNILDLVQSNELRLAYALRISSPQIDGAEWRYTDHPQDLIINGELFQARVLKLSGSKEGGDGSAKGEEFELTAERIEPFVSLVGRGMPFQFECRLSEVYISPTGEVYPDMVAEGLLVACSRTAAGIKAVFRPVAKYLDVKVPRLPISTYDPRMPYTPDFGVDLDQMRLTGTVFATSQNVLFSAVASQKPLDYFTGGFIEYERTIGGQPVKLRYSIQRSFPSDDAGHPEFGALVLSAPPVLLSENSGENEFSAFPGYDGSVGQSVDRFGNFSAGLGYFGFPKLPAQNPVLTSQVRPTPPVTGGDLPRILGFQNTNNQNIATANRNQTINVVGANFGSQRGSLLFNNVELAVPGDNWSNTAIRFTVPAEAALGPALLRVITRQELEDDNTDGPTLVIEEVGTKRIDGVQNRNAPPAPGEPYPNAGAPGQWMTVVGIGFGNARGAGYVKIGDLQLASGQMSDWTDKSINILVPTPPAFPYTGPVTVRTAAGEDIVSNFDFTINEQTAADLIRGYLNTADWPIQSGVAGSWIRILGSSFGGNRGSGWVRFYNAQGDYVQASAFDGWSHTLIKCRVPSAPGYPWTGPVRVRTDAGLETSGPPFTIGGPSGSVWLDACWNAAKSAPITGALEDVAFFIVGGNFAGSDRKVWLDLGGGQQIELKALDWGDLRVKVRIPPATGHTGETGELYITKSAGAITSLNRLPFTILSP